MTAYDGEPRKSKTLATLTDLVCKSATSPTPAQLSRGLSAVSGLLVVERARRSSLLRLSLAGMAAAACVGALLTIVSLSRVRRPPPVQPALAYRIEGGAVIEGGYLRESGSTGIKLAFSEGTTFSLMPGTHSRLRSVDGAGARIAIESGAASFEVTPRDDARWLVDVGPFLVTVKGTVFAVSWDVARERFEIRLQQGRVTVGGPVSGGDIALRAGQRLVVDLPRAESLITEEKVEEVAVGSGGGLPAADLPEERPSIDMGTLRGLPCPPTMPRCRQSRQALHAIAPDKPAREGGARSPAAKAAVQSRWAEAVSASDWDRILREAERAGVRSTLEEATSDDLFALADAARYRRRAELAREALLAQRRRFPGSARSPDAAYLLGRVEESSESGMARALRWYDEYLQRAPIGTYASESLGRKMILTGKLKGSAQARPLAEEYLRRFPHGAYAGSAQAMRRAP
jgi:hypothetical protein